MKVAWIIGIGLIGAIIFFAPRPEPQRVAAQAPQPVVLPKPTQRAAAPQQPKETPATEVNEPEALPGEPIYRPLAGGTKTTRPGTAKQNVISGGLQPGTDAYRPGQFGVGYPSCLYCPDPAYSEEARKAKFEGVVALQAIVRADGHATDIQVLKGVGLGLDEKAIEAVRKWRFEPAVGPEGKPVPTINPIRVEFRFKP